MKNIAVWSAVLGIILTQGIHASILDDTDKLKGQYIVEVGTLQLVNCPISGKYDCLTFPTNLYKLNYSTCIQIDGYIGPSSKVIIAADSTRKLTAFVFDSSLSNDLKQHGMTTYQCPDELL